MKAGKHPTTADFVKKETVEMNKSSNDTPGSQKEESDQIVHSDFDDRLSSKLQPGYTEPSTAIDEVRHSWVRKC